MIKIYRITLEVEAPGEVLANDVLQLLKGGLRFAENQIKGGSDPRFGTKFDQDSVEVKGFTILPHGRLSSKPTV